MEDIEVSIESNAALNAAVNRKSAAGEDLDMEGSTQNARSLLNGIFPDFIEAQKLTLAVDKSSEVKLKPFHELSKLRSTIPDKHATEKQILNLRIEKELKEYLDFFSPIGFNLVLHGYGSKYETLNSFAETIPRSNPILIFNGFHRGLTVKTVLTKIIKLLESIEQTFEITLKLPAARTKNIGKMTVAVRNSFQILHNCPKFKRLYIIFHNIDGQNLRNLEAQRVLAELSSLNKVSLIASIDSIHAGLLWNQELLERFNFLFMEAHTYGDYFRECQYMTPLMSSKNDTIAKGLSYIFKSITANQRGIVKILAKHQLEESDTFGLTVRDLFHKCREEMLATSEKQVKEYLVETKDHQIVHERYDTNGKLHLFLKYPDNILEKIVSETLD